MNLNSGFKWQPDAGLNRTIVPVSQTKMRQMGLPSDAAEHVKDLEELSKRPPNIIIAKCLKSMRFVQNYFKTQELKKNVDYIMGLGVYQQLHADPKFTKKKLLKPSKFKFSKLYIPYKGQSLEDKTLLVFRTGGIGDLLFIQPNLLYLKEKYPTCKIKFGCGPQYQAMVEAWDCVDEVLDLPFSIKHLRESDYHALFEGVIERCRLAENVNAFHLFTEWLGLNLPDELLIPKQEPKQDKLDFCYKKLEEWNVKPNDFILMQLRASSPIRTPNPKFWKEVVDALTDKGYKIILTDSPRQADNVDEFISGVKNPDKVFNFCKHSKSLDYSIALTKLCKTTVATDSAMNHIAASLGTHCYGIYGPFPGRVRLTTYPKAKWIDAERDCAPCYLHGQYPCPQAGADGFSPCYDNLNVEDIVKDVEEIMNNDKDISNSQE
jgi:ADP-heptose:LPS heptosyltransferase